MRLQSKDTVGPPKSESASKVCVTFYECKKPITVNPLENQEFYDSSYFDIAMSSPIPENILTPTLDRQSNGNGHDNPFRPDGDISREADEIVQRIKSGQSLVSSPHSPISNTSEPLHNANLNSPSKGKEKSIEIKAMSFNRQLPQHDQSQIDGGSPTKTSKAGLNGSSSKAVDPTSPGPVEVKHVTVTPTEPAQVEHVILKKKKKCACCVIQ